MLNRLNAVHLMLGRTFYRDMYDFVHDFKSKMRILTKTILRSVLNRCLV